jgi:hypothetical protein
MPDFAWAKNFCIFTSIYGLQFKINFTVCTLVQKKYTSSKKSNPKDFIVLFVFMAVKLKIYVSKTNNELFKLISWSIQENNGMAISNIF